MERGREGRRGVAGAAQVSAPRRPRTSGFKEAAAGEEGEDVMDDVHNPRLRERPKKESNSSALPGLPSGSLGPTSRNKRKRQGSQELQGQGRCSTVDDLDETTEETEMGASDDDDDPPPPPIPRRPGKLRPQGKFLEDGISADHPTVPRKARTAILKRPQEFLSPQVGDATHQGCTVTPRSPAPVSAPSSSSVVSLKPGRRMKPSGLKVRTAKASKVSTPTVISEQEVEVAEALFDLARMFTNQSASSKPEVSVDMNPETEAETKLREEPEMKLEANPLPNNIVARPPIPPFPSSRSITASDPVSTPIASSQSTPIVPLAAPNVLPPVVISSVPDPAMSTLPISDMVATSLLPGTAPPAEAPKRKRPRVKTKSDLTGCAAEVGLHPSGCDIPNLCGLTAPPLTLGTDQILTSSPPNTVSSFAKAETGVLVPGPQAVLVCATPTTTLPSALHSMNISSSVPVSINFSLEKRPVAAGQEAVKVELSSVPSPFYSLHSPQLDRKPAPSGVPSSQATLTLDTDQASSGWSGNEPPPNIDPGGRPIQQPSVTRDGGGTVGGRPHKFDFDLMALPTMKPALSPASERMLDISQNAVDDGVEKCPGNLRASLREPAWIEKKGGDNESEPELGIKHENLDSEKGRESENHRDKQQEERDHAILREGDCQRDFPKDRDGEEEWETKELAKQLPQQRQGKAPKSESRAQRMERTVSANATSALSSFLASSPLVASNVPMGVLSCPATSVAIPSWPVGLAPMGYYSSAAAAAVWPSGAPLRAAASLDESLPPAVQPYIIQARQPQLWKRCASHVYIAHFIDLQQQMNRNPFIHAAYQNSASVYGAKPYNLNIPLPPAEAMFTNGPGGPIVGCAGSDVSVITGGGRGSGLGSPPGNPKSVGVASLMSNSLSKDRAFGEPFCKKQPVEQQQQPPQPAPSLASQSGLGFGFPVTQACTGTVGGVAAAATAVNGGELGGNSGSGGVSAPVGVNLASTAGLNVVSGPGSSNGGVVSHAVAQAQYLQAVMQQGGFPFPLQAAAHFGPSFNSPGHIGSQQAAKFYGNPFYTTHLVHPAPHTQQQVQLGANVSGGAPSVQKQQQHALQQAVLNFPSRAPQQLTSLAPLSQLPSHTQQQHTQATPAQQIKHLAEREGNDVGDSSSSSESKFSMLQRNVYGQGNPSITVSATPSSSLVPGGGVHSLPSQDFNLNAALGAKQQQGQLSSQQQALHQQQPQAALQHGSGPPLQTTLKGMDQQSPQTFSALSAVAMNRAPVVGPGPLGLASVAAVMAPQGHAMLHSVADPARGHGQSQQGQHHQSTSGQSQQPSLQSGQQQLQQRVGVHVQRVALSIAGAEDSRTIVDGSTFSSRSGREAVEDRKVPTKRGMNSPSNLSRLDLDNSLANQGAPTAGGLPLPRITSSGGPTLNLMAQAPTILLSRTSGHPHGSGLQQPGAVLGGNQNSKQTLSRGKLLAGLGGGALVPSTQSQSLPDRPSLTPSSSKVQLPPLSLSGQNVAQSTQVPRQGPMPPHQQLKLSNRGSLGSLPTPSGTAPQAVLAAAIAKSQQGPQQQQSRPQAQVGTNTGPQPRLLSGNCSSALTSTSIPLPPLPPLSKSAPTSASKCNFSIKNSFPLAHKASSGVPGKRTAQPSVSHVSSILGPSPLAQNLPLKSFQSQLHSQVPSQQPQQNMSQYHSQPSKPTQQPLQQHSSQASLSLVSTPYHQQQAHLSSQQLQQVHNKQALIQQQQMQRIFLQNPAFQQLQQSPGSLLTPHTQHQQLPHHVHQQTVSPPAQSPQHLSSPQVQQQPQQQHQEQLNSGSCALIGANGSLSLGPPTLTLGTGNNGFNSSARPSGPDNLAASQGPGSRSTATANRVSGSGTSQSSSRSHGGSNFLQAQFVSNLPSGQQQSCSPQISSGPQYLQAIVNSESSGKQSEQKIMSDGNCQEQVNGIRKLSPARMPQMAHPGSPGLQPVSNRQATGGTSTGKSVGVQFAGNNFSEGIGPRSGLILSVAPPSLSSSNMSQSPKAQSNNGNSGGLNSNVHGGLDVRPLFGGSNQGAITSQDLTGSVHQSLHSAAPGSTPNSSQSISQTSTNVAQP